MHPLKQLTSQKLPDILIIEELSSDGSGLYVGRKEESNINLLYILLGILFFSIPIYTFMRMVWSLTGKNKKDAAVIADTKSQAIEICYYFLVLGIIALGLLLNDLGVEGGIPLNVYEMTGKAATSYAALSQDSIFTIAAFLVLSSLAYSLLIAEKDNLSPVVNAVCSSLLILNIIFTIIYFTHTGFLYNQAVFGIDFSIFLLQIGYASLSFLYIAKLKDSLDHFLKEQEKQEHQPDNKFMLFLYRISFSYQRLPVLWSLLLFPVLIAVQLVLILFGQRPDSAIRVFLDTSSFTYSRLPAPKPEIIQGDGHYLCTVSVKGHKKLVKPVRAGVRHGNRIVVNRQLLVANAFENILEEYTPKCHKAIRKFYDKHGYPLSRHINSKWTADIVYILMKPLEWLFLLVVYTVDKNPENRINVQYSELRK